MKKTTQIKAMLFSIFLFVGCSGLFAQPYHLKTNIQDWRKTNGLTENYRDYTSKTETKWCIVKEGKVGKLSKLEMGDCSEDYIQLRRDDRRPSVVKFRSFTGVKRFTINLVGDRNNTKIKLFNGREKLIEFKDIGTKGVSKTYVIPEGREGETFEFILKDQNSTVYICDIRILKAGAEEDGRVEIPKFSKPSDEYYEPISVEISTPTAEATIRYTTDKSEPTKASPLYTAPITVSQATTLKARAFKKGLEASDVAEADYTIVTLQEVGTLGELRNLGDGKKVKYTGEEAIVTFVSKNKKFLYIQDGTGAIRIFDGNAKHFSNCEIGSKIKEIIAKTNTRFKMFGLEDVKNAIIEGKGVIEPTEIELKDLKPAHQSQLVKVENVKLLKEEKTTFKTRESVKIEGTDVVVRPEHNDLDYEGQPIPDGAQTIVAIVLVDENNKIQLMPRSFEEMITTGLARIPATTKLYSTEGKIHFEAKTGESVEVYNAIGQLIYKTTAHSGLNTIDAPQGIIILKIGDAIEKMIVK